jgi:uncharacterized repeat protein (TIGR03803 family)
MNFNLIGRAPLLASLVVIALVSAPASQGSSIRVLYAFGAGIDGAGPYGGLIFDSVGNLYGTTTIGGVYDQGTVFELTVNSDGTYSETVLHSFNPNAGDGSTPYCSLALDRSGNLYGTTYYGGTYGNGTVFELARTGNGMWSERILHHFDANAKDGFNPYAGLTPDVSGNFYGTTYQGGSQGGGTVYELVRGAGGKWQYKTLYGFDATDGDGIMGAVIFDPKGNLYGTTEYGGTYQHGVVFELVPTATGKWSGKTLHSFNPDGGDGYEPYSGLAIDSKGNLYGTTLYGGVSSDQGAVYELSRTSKGWHEKIIHSFAATGDGIDPYGPPVVDSAGNVYGTTWQSLVDNVGGAGIVFELSPAGSTWQETILNNFTAPEQYGNPYSGLILDKEGNLYGTAYGGSVVYQVTP